MTHPLTVIAATLAGEIPSVARSTRKLGDNLAGWIENEAQAMSPDDDRKPGYMDLANRLRNL